MITRWTVGFLLQNKNNNFFKKNGIILKLTIIVLLVLFFFQSSLILAHSTSLINGGVVTGSILYPSEQDSYTFTANAGENFQIRAADTSNSDFVPHIRLYDPSGSSVGSSVGQDVATLGGLSHKTGTYTLVVGDAYPFNRTGNYDIYFARMPGANEGGTLTNGGVVSGEIDLGDLDSYTFTANAGENFQIRAADTSNSDFVPHIRLYDPSGSSVGSSAGQDVATLGGLIHTTGTYTIVVGDAYPFNRTGNYNLELDIDREFLALWYFPGFITS